MHATRTESRCQSGTELFTSEQLSDMIRALSLTARRALRSSVLITDFAVGVEELGAYNNAFSLYLRRIFLESMCSGTIGTSGLIGRNFVEPQL